MKVDQKNNVFELGSTKLSLDTVASELAAKDCARQIEFLKERVSLPRIIRIDALRSVLNKYVKMAKDLNLTDEFEYRLNWYQSFTEYQLVNFWHILARDNSNVFNEANEYQNFKQAFAKLLLINAKAIKLSEEDIVTYQRMHKGEGLDLEQFLALSDPLFYDFENSFDGLSFDNLKTDLKRSSTVNDIRAIASKYELNVPKRLKKEQLVELVAEGLNRQGKLESDTVDNLKKMSAILLQHFAKQNGIKASTEMKKDDTIEYILTHADEANKLIWKKPIDIETLVEVQEFEFSKEFLRDVQFKDEEEEPVENTEVVAPVIEKVQEKKEEPAPAKVEEKKEEPAPVKVEEKKEEEKEKEVALKDVLDENEENKSANGVSKEAIAEHLQDKYGKNVTVNRRKNYTENGLLQVADTHFTTSKKRCFTYVYENNNGFVVALFKLDQDALKEAKKVCKVTKSSFPKCKENDWYSVAFNEDIPAEDCFKLFDIAIEGQGVQPDVVEQPKIEVATAKEEVKEVMKENKETVNNTVQSDVFDDIRFKAVLELYKERIDSLEKLLVENSKKPINVTVNMDELVETVTPIKLSGIETVAPTVACEEKQEEKEEHCAASLDPVVIDSRFSALTNEEKAKMITGEMENSSVENVIANDNKKASSKEEAKQQKLKAKFEKAVYDREISQYKRRKSKKVGKVIGTIILIVVLLFVACTAYSVLADVVFSGENPIIPASVSETVDKYLGYTKIFAKGESLRGALCGWVQGLLTK